MSQTQQKSAAEVPVPLPSGLNVADPVAALPPGDCPILDNLIRDEYGLRVRHGSVDWCASIGLDLSPYPAWSSRAYYGVGDTASASGIAYHAIAEGGNHDPSTSPTYWAVDAGKEVRTLLPYQGSDTSQDRLFACTSVGIYDVTSSAGSPTCVCVFPEQSSESGWGNSVVFQTVADRFLCYCDEANGYIRYTESTGTWYRMTAAEITGGADPNTFAHVCAWKNRLWFTQKDSSAAWYLDVGLIQGAAAKWEFGNRLRYGGSLVGLWNWTLDGGVGIDDHLVAITTGGDVAIYQGTNPSSASAFAVRGAWYVGSVPAGRRICSDIGGDLLVLTNSGLLPLSRLVQGADQLSPDAYTTRKISPLVARYMDSRRTRLGWAIRTHPEDNALLILMPILAGQTAEQLAMSLPTKGWARYRGLGMVCADTWRGQLYFGTQDGRVVKNTGWADGVKLDGAGATTISWSGLTGFTELGAPGRMKRLLAVRPYFVTAGTSPSWGVGARYEFDVSTLPSAAIVSPAAAGWDIGTWDGTLVWGDGTGTASQWIGATGCGRQVAIAFWGASKAKTTLAGVTALADAGGDL